MSRKSRPSDEACECAVRMVLEHQMFGTPNVTLLCQIQPPTGSVAGSFRSQLKCAMQLSTEFTAGTLSTGSGPAAYMAGYRDGARRWSSVNQFRTTRKSGDCAA